MPKRSNKGLIIGLVVGFLLLLLVASTAFYFWVLRKPVRVTPQQAAAQVQQDTAQPGAIVTQPDAGGTPAAVGADTGTAPSGIAEQDAAVEAIKEVAAEKPDTAATAKPEPKQKKPAVTKRPTRKPTRKPTRRPTRKPKKPDLTAKKEPPPTVKKEPPPAVKKEPPPAVKKEPVSAAPPNTGQIMRACAGRRAAVKNCYRNNVPGGPGGVVRVRVTIQPNGRVAVASISSNAGAASGCIKTVVGGIKFQAFKGSSISRTIPYPLR